MRVKTMNKRKEMLLVPSSLDEKIATDNIVRLIDAFVDSLDMESLDFTIRHKNKSDPGAPEYHPSDLLKIYIYRYINRTRSSRQLEKCCKINIEMMWLVKGLTPGYVTIANFRKNNPKALKKVFRAYNRFLQGEDLFGEETIAVDGAKIRAQNSKKNNFSDKSIERHQSYIDKKTEEYLALLDQRDEQANELISKNEISEKLKQLSERKNKEKSKYLLLIRTLAFSLHWEVKARWLLIYKVR
jgi:transposase